MKRRIVINDVVRVHVGDTYFPRNPLDAGVEAGVTYQVVAVDVVSDCRAHLTVHSTLLDTDIRVPDSCFHHAERLVNIEPPEPPTPTEPGYYEDHVGQIWAVFPDGIAQRVGHHLYAPVPDELIHDPLKHLPTELAPYHRVWLTITRQES
jgi:hypothetical protein